VATVALAGDHRGACAGEAGGWPVTGRNLADDGAGGGARRRAWPVAALVLRWSAATTPAFAQPYLDYYLVRHADRMTLDWKAFYERVNRGAEAVRRTYPHALGLKYGDHAKQALDLYLPSHDLRDAPVVLFIHGGSFMEGDRSDYGYVARALLAERAIVAVNELSPHGIDASLYVAGGRDHQQIVDDFAQPASALVAQMRPLLQSLGARQRLDSESQSSGVRGP
jgi:hypothetical protein